MSHWVMLRRHDHLCWILCWNWTITENLIVFADVKIAKFPHYRKNLQIASQNAFFRLMDKILNFTHGLQFTLAAQAKQPRLPRGKTAKCPLRVSCLITMLSPCHGECISAWKLSAGVILPWSYSVSALPCQCHPTLVHKQPSWSSTILWPSFRFSHSLVSWS